MYVEVLKTFTGYSGSIVNLMKNNNGIFVRKSGNIKRNLTQLKVLQTLNIPVPKIYAEHVSYYDMEYVPHQDMKTWLTRNNTHLLTQFLISIFSKFSQNTKFKNYSETYYAKLSWLDTSSISLPFTKENLISRLPPALPQSVYHGDLTLENILYGNDFVLIDPLESEYDSWVFDLAKLRQDIETQWFLRNSNHNIHAKLENILLALKQQYEPKYFSNELLILMLLRVYPYCKNAQDQNWIIKEIIKLWK